MEQAKQTKPNPKEQKTSTAIITLLLLVFVIFIFYKMFTIGNTDNKHRKSTNQTATTQTQPIDSNVNLVASSIVTNNFGIDKTKLLSTKNPNGEGTLVYVKETNYSGVERNFIWVVLDNEAYPLNGPSMEITSGLKWPRDISDEEWNKTGLNKYNAQEAIDIVF